MLLSLIQSYSSVRVLDIYAKNAHDPICIRQLHLLNADPKGLKERDVIIKQHFGAPGFRITLTGKDGGEKYSSAKILTSAKLYAIIDAMPMRKEEMSKH
jgi:hypothetical protein